MPKLPFKPSISAPSSERAKAFRDRLGEMELTRWEIVASEETKLKVRTIANAEGLTSGVAAEALLQLGIEAYDALRRPVASAALATPPSDSAQGIKKRAFALSREAQEPGMAAMPQQVPVVLSAKSLAAYTTRSQPGQGGRSAPPSSEDRKAAAPLQGFFDRAKQRKPR
jgi:hypothetical protein